MQGTIAKRYCLCGYPMWAEYRFNGFYHAPVFLEFREALARAEVIRTCPRCGKSLYPDINRQAPGDLASRIKFLESPYSSSP